MARTAVLLALLGLWGCTEQVAACDGGWVFTGSTCVPLDAGEAMDAGPTDAGPDIREDGGPDAGPCGDSCASDELCDEALAQCVECLDESSCEDPTRPVCSDGACIAGCGVEADCRRFMTHPRCELDSGACVACLPASEDADCMGTSCHPTDFVCTETNLGSVQRCQPCRSTSECDDFEPGSLPMACAVTAAGSFCLVDYGARGGITCPKGTTRVVNDVPLASGATSSICLPVAETTCTALLDRSMCSGDDECGAPGLEDALCFMGTCQSRCNASAGDNGCPGSQTCFADGGDYVCNG